MGLSMAVAPCGLARRGEADVGPVICLITTLFPPSSQSPTEDYLPGADISIPRL